MADEWQGVLVLEVPLALRSTSGRAKHLDPEEQGTMVAWATTEWWREKFEEAGLVDDHKLGDWRLVGFREKRWTEWEEELEE